MSNFNSILLTVAILLLLAVAYVTFWVLVIAFIAYVVYQLVKLANVDLDSIE